MIGVFDIFKPAIGPSSSHTTGPMRAAHTFVDRLRTHQTLAATSRIRIELFGALAATGRGHGTDRALLLGLEGHQPDTVDPTAAASILDRLRREHLLRLPGGQMLPFDPETDLVFHRKRSLPRHPNGMRFHAFDSDSQALEDLTAYSIGGGFVVYGDADGETQKDSVAEYPFPDADALLSECRGRGCPMSGIMLRHETQACPEREIWERLRDLRDRMAECVDRGCRSEGELPGGLGVRRRAAALHHDLCNRPEAALRDPLSVLDWVNLYALAVNEENAAGGRVVTAPTNGAAGIIPAVLLYAERFCAPRRHGPERFLLTAGAIGLLYQRNASISGADVGCQGEVGVACSMAAGALTETLGGTPDQVEMAAEIGMEHNLGLTCDPVGGLVQIPCIERNAMGAIKAINAARLALRSDGRHCITLDRVIRVMRDTGRDMKKKYKETSRGGLAVSLPEC